MAYPRYKPLGQVNLKRRPQRPMGMDAQIQAIVGRMPAPMTPAQIRSQAQGMIDPVVQDITRRVTQQTQGGLQAVGGYANSLASALAQSAPQGVARAYDPAQASMAAASSAFANRLSGEGGRVADDLAQRLAAINAPAAVDPAVAAVRQQGAASGNALYAHGNASLEHLINSRAAAMGYAEKLPDIARLEGLRQTGLVQRAGATQLAEETGAVLGQLPGIMQGLRGVSEQRAANRANAGLDLREFFANQANVRQKRADDLSAERNRTRQEANELGLERAKAALAVILANGIDPDTGALTPAAAAQASRLASMIGGGPIGGLTGISGSTAARIRNDTMDDEARDRDYRLDVKEHNRKVKKDRRDAQQDKQGGGLSAASWRTLVSDATKQARDLATSKPARQRYNTELGDFEPVPDTGQSATLYPEALKQIIQLGPDTPRWRDKATRIVNAQYDEGEAGRPYSPKKAKATAAQAARLAYKARKPYQQALSTFLENTRGIIPPDVARAEYARAYFFTSAFSPVPGSANWQAG